MSLRVIGRVFTFVLAVSAPALAEQRGTFTATRACPLYQSMRKHTNPGNYRTEKNVVYAIFEANPSLDDADWFRVQVPGLEDLRWVEGRCGKAKLSVQKPSDKPEKPTQPGKSSCHEANTYDSHVLAISWQAGFCSIKSSKPECGHLWEEPYASTHFTLHGLWPNKDVCGKRYDFCGKVTKEAPNMCTFPAVSLSPAIEAELASVMPSEKYKSCLERHEWWKHGTCRDQTADAYFAIAMKLLSKLNESSFVSDFIARNIGHNVYKTRFYAEFDKAFGAGASDHVLLQCSDSTLTEVQINLPKLLDEKLSINELIHAGPEQKKADSCDDSFFILKAQKP